MVKTQRLQAHNELPNECRAVPEVLTKLKTVKSINQLVMLPLFDNVRWRSKKS